MDPITTILTWKKSTKHTQVYENDAFGAAISTLYVARHVLPAQPPGKLNVTLSTEEAAS